MKRIVITLLTLLLWIPICAKVYNSEIVKQVSHYQVKGGKLLRKDTVVLQINNRAGDISAQIGIAYSKGDNLSIGNSWIEDANGKIVRKLKKNEIEDASYISGFSLYQDDFIKSFSLNHNTYPYRVVYSYTLTYSKFWWITSIDFTNVNRKVKSYDIIVETPTDYKIKYKYNNINDPIINSGGSTNKYIWKINYSPEEVEWNSPSKSSTAPQLTILPQHFKYGKAGSWESWQTFGDWIVDLNKGRDELPDSEKAKIDKLLVGVTDNIEKAKILYQYMQDYTRYINVSVKVGGMQTYPASYVCDNRYGDCKALSNYYQAMLKYVGIESFYTIINLSDKIEDIDEDFASQEFNHIILTIPFGNDTVYQECTSKNNPFGYVHTSIQGRKALLVSEGKSRLINIPSMDKDDVLCSRNIITEIKRNYTELNLKYRGGKFELYSQFIEGISKNNKDSYLQRSLLTASYNLIEYNIQKEKRDSKELTLFAKCFVDNQNKKYGNNLILSPFSIAFPTYETVENRTKAFQIDYPKYYKDTITYSIENSEILVKPSNITIECRFGHYHLIFELAETKLIVYKSILINKGTYPLCDYGELYEFFTKIKNIENKKYYLEIL